MAGMSQDILFPLEKVKVKTLKASFTEQRDKPELNDYDTFVKLCNQLISVMAPEVTCAKPPFVPESARSRPRNWGTITRSLRCRLAREDAHREVSISLGGCFI